MSNTSLISIIVPLYNSQATLYGCIDSLVCQSYPNIEIILVDDGSTDNSLNICNTWAIQDDRVKVLSQPNLGVSEARNNGIRHSTGEYIMLLDSDDWYDLQTCEIMLNTLLSNDVDCVICGFNQTSGNVWAPKKNIVYRDKGSFLKDYVYWINTELLSSSVNKIYKRDKIKNLYPEDIAFGEDLIFSLAYLKNCYSVAFISNPLYQHDVFNTSSLTHSWNIKRFSDIERIQSVILEMCVDQPSDSKIYDKYLRDIAHTITCLFRSEISKSEKLKILRQWHTKSYFRNVNINRIFHIPGKRNLLLLLLIYMHLYNIAQTLIHK